MKNTLLFRYQPIKNENNNNDYNNKKSPETYRLKFINSFRFMSISLSSLVDNLSEIYKKQCKKCKERKKAISECKFFDIKGNKLSYTCKECNDKSHKSVNGLKEKFPNTYQFCNEHLDKFVSLLRKSVYPYEDMDRWEKCNEASLADK